MENTKDNLVEDAFRELEEKEAIYKLPWNGLSISALENIKKSELTIRLENRYKNMSLGEFLKHTSINDKYAK